MQEQNATRQKALVALAAIFLALTYVIGGYAVVQGVPQVVESAASATIDDSGSPFSKEALVEGALATREYSFGSHDLDAYLGAISSMNAEASTPYADASTEELLSAPEQYTVNEEAISHLDDVNDVASRLFIPMLSVALIAAMLMMYALRYFGIESVGRMLLYSGIGVLVVMAVLGIWALISFDSFFYVFHSLFFAEGSWTFPADSLLITMLPEAFWSAIGLVWLGVSALLAALSVAFGLVIRLRAAKR